MQDDPYFKTAAGCFGLARNYLRKPILGDISLDVHEYYQAVCEIVVFLLHLSDRLIFEAAPSSRNVRMDALVAATIRLFTEEIRADPNIENSNDAAVVATQIFRDLYDDRTEEYAGVGTDWFRLILLKFGRHFSEAVNRGELSMEIFMDVQAEAVRMQVALLDFGPELFKP